MEAVSAIWRALTLQISDQTLLSGRLDKYYRGSAWAVTATFFTCLYVSYEGPAALNSPLKHLSVRILFGLVGAAGAGGGLFLAKGMWTHWRLNDVSSKNTKRIWFIIMTIGVIFGSAAYYFFVYRREAPKRESES